jgi:DNA-binding NarL/FixJ family response regulator
MEKALNQGLRILIVDDHYFIRQGLRRALAESFDRLVCGEAEDGQRAIEMVWKENWDVVLLDISMPGRGGLDTLKDIKRERPTLPVIILSMHDEDQFAIRALQRGASAYISKSMAGAELLKAIRAVLQGHRYITSSLAEKLAQHVNEDRGAAPHEVLTDREYQVMCFIASGKTVKEIASALSLSVKTVSTYRSRILEKMSFENNSQMMRYAVSRGLVDLQGV